MNPLTMACVVVVFADEVGAVAAGGDANRQDHDVEGPVVRVRAGGDAGVELGVEEAADLVVVEPAVRVVVTTVELRRTAGRMSRYWASPLRYGPVSTVWMAAVICSGVGTQVPVCRQALPQYSTWICVGDRTRPPRRV